MCNFQVFLCCCFFTNFWGAKSALLCTLFACLTRRNSSLSQWPCPWRRRRGALPLFHFLLRWPWTSFVAGPQGWKHLCTKSWQCRAIYLGLTIACFSSLLVCYQEEKKYLPLNSIIVLNRWEAEIFFFKISILKSPKMFVKTVLTSVLSYILNLFMLWPLGHVRDSIWLHPVRERSQALSSRTDKVAAYIPCFSRQSFPPPSRKLLKLWRFWTSR